MADAPTKKEEPALPADVKPAETKAEAVEPTPAEPKPPVASDPEEDDLSDLDDVLDEFSATKIDDSKKPAPPAAAAAATTAAPAPATTDPGKRDPAELLVEDEDEFAKQLQKEMEQLLGQGDFQKQFDDIMKEMSAEVGADEMAKLSAAAPGASSSDPTKKEEQSFQETIRRTMERMQESGDAAGAAAASSDENDILAQMLKEMEGGGFGGGEGNDEDFSKILMGMMEQLTNKEILYEPMKELNDKFPKWMEDNKDKVSAEDLKRYEEQHTLVKEITARFEKSGYSDSNAQDREYIVERMQKMQAAGSPPPDLVGDMNAAQEALQEIDQGCPTQ